jgi:hypothetical protein
MDKKELYKNYSEYKNNKEKWEYVQ